jgi:hypothetical protein
MFLDKLKLAVAIWLIARLIRERIGAKQGLCKSNSDALHGYSLSASSLTPFRLSKAASFNE